MRLSPSPHAWLRGMRSSLRADAPSDSVVLLRREPRHRHARLVGQAARQSVAAPNKSPLSAIAPRPLRYHEPMSPRHPRPPRHLLALPGMEPGSRPAHAHEQSRPRGRRASRRPGGLRRRRQSRPRLAFVPRHRARARKSLDNDETLLVQSGRPVGVFRTHEEAPRVLIANANLVGHWSNWEQFRASSGWASPCTAR